MGTIGKIICGTAVLWTVSTMAHAAVTAADEEAKKMNACLAMSPDALTGDTDCSDLMKRKNITVADMQTMKTCKAMKADTMAKDETCASMAQKHPDIMRPQVQ